MKMKKTQLICIPPSNDYLYTRNNLKKIKNSIKLIFISVFDKLVFLVTSPCI